MNYSRNRYNYQDDFLGPNDVEFPSDENDHGRDRDIENLRPLNFEPKLKMSNGGSGQLLNMKNNNAFRDFTPGGILKNSQHIQKTQRDVNKFNDRNNNHNGSYYNQKNSKFQRNNQQPPLFRDEQDQPVEDSKNRLCNSPKSNSIHDHNNNFQMNATISHQRPPSKFVYSNQNSMNNGLMYSNNNKTSSFNHSHSRSNGSIPSRDMNRNVTHNNFKTNNNSNSYQQRPRNNFQENNMNIRQNIHSNVNPQNNILNLFGNLSTLLKTNNNNNNSMMSNSNDQSNNMPLSTIFESVALLQALTNPETLNQTISLLNNIKNSNPQPILVEDNEPATVTQAFSPEDPSGSEIMGNNAPIIQKENNTHSFSFLDKLNKTVKNRPEIVNNKPKQDFITVPEKENQKSSSSINKNQLASKLELLLSFPTKETTQDEFEEIKTPEISPQQTPTKTLPIKSQPEPQLSPIKSPSLKPVSFSPPPLAFSARPNTFHPLPPIKTNQTPQLLNSQLMSFVKESSHQQQQQQQSELEPSLKPKLLDFFEDKVQLGTKEKDIEKHQRQYKLMGSDRPLLTQEKNLVEKLERFANEEKKNPEEKKPIEPEEKDDNDEFNFESRYFMYNPTQICNRCKKPGHFEKMCSEENLIKCGFCVGCHKMANCDQIVCFKCLKVGHRMQNCQSQHTVTCFRCQKKGHTYHNCGVMMPKDPKATFADKERDMYQIKCSSCNQYGHINCKIVKKMYIDDLYQDYRQNNQV